MTSHLLNVTGTLIDILEIVTISRFAYWDGGEKDTGCFTIYLRGGAGLSFEELPEVYRAVLANWRTCRAEVLGNRETKGLEK